MLKHVTCNFLMYKLHDNKFKKDTVMMNSRRYQIEYKIYLINTFLLPVFPSMQTIYNPADSC